jgi:hypothetical protein
MNLEQAEYARRVAKWAMPGTPGYDQNEWILVLYPGEYEDDGSPETVPIAAMREGSCQTTACIAGGVAIERAPEGTMVVDGVDLIFPDGEVVSVPDFATQELGLTYDQALTIFWVPAPYAAQRLAYVADHPGAGSEEIRDAFPIPVEVADMSWPELD